MSYRFCSLKEADDCGLLVKKGGKPVPALFLTPRQAKSLAQRKALTK